MDWKREAIEKLRDYEAHQRAIENIADELERLGAEFVGIRGAAIGCATAARGDGRGAGDDAKLSNIAHRQELRRALKQAKLWVKTAERAMSALDEDERLALERFYIHSAKGNVQWLCDELAVEQSTVYRLRDRALRRFTVALYGITEN